MIKTRSIRFKISILYVGILTLILLAYSAILYSSLNRILYRDVDTRLKTKTREVADLLSAVMLNPGVVSAGVKVASTHIILHHDIDYATQDAIERRVLAMLDQYEMRGDYVALLTASLEPVTVSNNFSAETLRIFLSEAAASELRKPALKTLHLDQRPVRLITSRVTLPDGSDYVIQIAASLKSVQESGERLLLIIGLSLPVIVLLASFVGSWLASSILRPVQAVAATAEGITHEDLSARVTIGDSDEEMVALAAAFNRMIERLEKSFHHISEFSSQAAHELKTPLAVIRGECEIALKKERSSEEYREALQANLREAQRMIRVVEDMLLLSRLDYAPQELDFRPLDFGKFLQDLAEKTRILAAPKKIQVVCRGQAEGSVIQADELHLRRLFFNILDNAVKFTPEGGSVTLEFKRDGGKAVTTISDTGPGISETDLPRIFEKFFHRVKGGSAPGNGLGLCIALSIAKAHHSDISVKSRPGAGTSFEVSLPALQN